MGMMNKSKKKKQQQIELTEEEIKYLYTMIHMLGFREKSEFPLGRRTNRTEMQKIVGKILKKLRKANHFISN
jgi:hypothetical protein